MIPNSKAPPSILSQTHATSIEDQKERKVLIEGKSSLIDFVFPITDEILKHSKLPSIIYYFLYLLNINQIIAVSFWTTEEDLYLQGSISSDILNYFWDVAFFRKIGNNLFPVLLIAVSGTIIFFGILLAQFIYYIKYRRFIRWTLYFTRFAIEFIPFIFLSPIADFIGQCYDIIIESSNRSTESIVFFTIGIICLFGLLLARYIVAQLFSRTTYLSMAPNACWSGNFDFVFVTGNIFFVIIVYLIKVFPEWPMNLVLISKISFDIYICYEATYCPFVHIGTNITYATIFTSAAAIDSITLFQHLSRIRISTNWKVLVLILFIFISGIIWKIIFVRINNRVTKHMNMIGFDENELRNELDEKNNDIKLTKFDILTDEMKRRIFHRMNLNNNFRRSELNLRIGIANYSHLFLDWSLIRYIAEFHHNSKMIGNILQAVSFFPEETRLLNYFFNELCKKPNLLIGERFLIYQVHRIKNLRLSSTSPEVTEKLIDMKSKSMDGIADVYSFWRDVPRDPSVLYNIQKNTRQMIAFFKEDIENWPNNTRFCDEYSKYLVENATRFKEGLVYKHRAALTEQGKNFVVDVSFISLVQAFQGYLRKGIMDRQGHYLKNGHSIKKGTTAEVNPTTNENNNQKKSSSGSNSLNNSRQVSSDIINNEIEDEVEENIGKDTLSNHKLRLAFERAIDGHMLHQNKILKNFTIFCTIMSISLIIGIFLFLYNKFSDIQTSIDDQLILNDLRFGFEASMVSTLIHWAKMIGFISDELYGNAKQGLSMENPYDSTKNLQYSSAGHNDDGKTDENMTFQDYYIIDEILKWILFSSKNINIFQENIYKSAYKDYNKKNKDDMAVFISQSVPIDICSVEGNSVGQISSPINFSLKTVLSYSLMKIALYTSNKNITQYNFGLCNCIVNMKKFSGYFDNLTWSIKEHQDFIKTKIQKVNIVILSVITFGLFIPVEIIIVILFINSYKELKAIIEIMAKIDKKTRELAALTIGKGSSYYQIDENLFISQNKINKKSIRPVLSCLAIVLVGLIVNGIIVALVTCAMIQNNMFEKYYFWITWSVSRRCYLIEIMYFVMIRILISQNKIGQSLITFDETSIIIQNIINNLNAYNNDIMKGNGKIGACFGYSIELDKIHFQNFCINDSDHSSFHDTYKCSSLYQSFDSFLVFVNELFDQPTEEKLGLNGSFYKAFHVMNVHMLDRCAQASELMAQLADTSIYHFRQRISIVASIGIPIVLFFFVIVFNLLSKFDVAFDGALQLIRRLPPLQVATNHELIKYLFNKKTEKENGKMTKSRLVITNYKDCFICLNKNESIEVINNAVTDLYGFTPEQLLGQSISSILNEEKNQKIFEQIKIMRDGEGPLIFNTIGYGSTDNEQEIRVNITLIGVANGENVKEAKSFVVIMKDETVVYERQKEAEAAKKQSEHLLFQILPRDIVNRLNSGETDISFSVNSASVIFIDICKFSDYSSTLSPQQIMTNLSTVFAAFDTCISKFSLMTKIKLIGDIYMAAANLFSSEETVQTHATQTVQFGLDSLSALEEVNSILSSNLIVRIGVNSGGPLIAGVLGTDKPVFDIIGDIINVAARLQTSGIPGTIQISESTYDAVKENGFLIEERGEIFLKGKGNRTTYIIRPIYNQNSFLIAGTES